MPKKTKKGLTACAKMMVKMLELGWEKKDLPLLEKLFWNVRDHNGELKRKKP